MISILILPHENKDSSRSQILSVSCKQQTFSTNLPKLFNTKNSFTAAPPDFKLQG